MKFKKIIAREFLFILSIAFLLTLVFIGFKIYNASQKKKIESIRTQTLLLENNYQRFLSQPLKIKDSILNQSTLNKIIEFYKTNNEVKSYNVIYNKFPQLKNDSLLLNASFEYNATINSGKYKSLKEVNLKFPEFFIINKSDIDSLGNFKIQIELLQKDTTKHDNSIFSTNDILNYLNVFGFWLLIVVFGLRYLFYATKWAIQTIKTKE
jgi:hypothetical protein